MNRKFWRHENWLAATFLFFSTFAACGQSTNVADVYASIGFNPSATNCGVLVQITDIHMALSANLLVSNMIVTNLDPRLVSMINAVTPQPTAMIVTGDLGTAGAAAFGAIDYEPQATNEIVLARDALKQFTNYPVYIIPGNHDNPAYEVTNAAIFNSVLTNSRFTNFTIAGLPIIGLAGHGGGWLDPEERAWLGGMREKLDHTKPVLVAIHQQIFSGLSWDSREARRDLEWFFKPWTAPVWTMSGHAHIRDSYQFKLGMTTVSSYVCPAAQNWLIPTSNPFAASACGFYLWCITNGTVAGVIEGVLTNQTYYPIGCDFGPRPSLYDGITNVEFLAEEGHFNRSTYNVSVFGGSDVTYWRSYVTSYTCQLPMAKYPTATQALLLANTADGTVIYLGKDTNSMVSVPVNALGLNVFSAVIPPNLRTGPAWMTASNSVNVLFVGGFGLGTTNAITDFQAWAGLTTGDSSIQPMTILTNAGNISAWDAYLFGLDAFHTETLREQPNYPSLGTLPYIGSGLLRFPGRVGVPYQVTQSPTANGVWTTVTNLLVITTTNGWNEYVISNSAPSEFYKIGSPAQH